MRLGGHPSQEGRLLRKSHRCWIRSSSYILKRNNDNNNNNNNSSNMTTPHTMIFTNKLLCKCRRPCSYLVVQFSLSHFVAFFTLLSHATLQRHARGNSRKKIGSGRKKRRETKRQFFDTFLATSARCTLVNAYFSHGSGCVRWGRRCLHYSSRLELLKK